MDRYLGNNFLQASSGELIRAIYVGRENDLSISFVLAIGLVERFMELAALVIIGSISLVGAGIVSIQLVTVLKAMAIVAIMGLTSILVALALGNRLVNLVPAVPATKPSAREKVEDFLRQFLRGIEALHHPLRAGIFLLFTRLVWVIAGIRMVILTHSLHLDITLVQSLLLLAGLSSAIPSTLGYVGVYQFAAVIVQQ